jgi:RNA polymerase sigma-70 factor (ECF subfamily)
MDCKNDYIELVRQAQLGSKDSMDALAEHFRGRLYAYVYRIVVDKDFAQDIVQESMLQMLKVIDKLERADRFWPWLRAIAFNRIRRAYNEGKSRRRRALESASSGHGQDGHNEGGLAKLVADELREAVVTTIRELKPQHRRILAMRCYEEMEYAEIAKMSGCSELGARVRFCRAKRALRRRLSSKGFGRGFMVTALVIFGKLTAPSEAAAANLSISAATTKAGIAAGLLSVLGSKTGVISLLAAGVVGVGTTVVSEGLEAGRIEHMLREMQVGQTVTQAAEGAEESWYYYPLGSKGPVMMRTVRWESESDGSYRQMWQDAEADYFYDQKKNTIIVNNGRMWGRGPAVQRLPTDGVHLRTFISSVEDIGDGMEYISGDGKGLLVIVRRGGLGEEGVKVVYHRNLMSEEYFRYKWPRSAEVIDKRDVMHKRGWTYFRISGEIGGEEIVGKGRIPFAYAARKGYYPWLELAIGRRLKIIDSGEEAVVYNGVGEVQARYTGGRFFEGLGRPWMGLHTIDTVRRDAARNQLWFETEMEAGEDQVRVIVNCQEAKLVYTIDIEKDVVESIVFSGANGVNGELKFSYLQELGEAGGEFASPRPGGSRRGAFSRLGGLWLVKLGDKEW